MSIADRKTWQQCIMAVAETVREMAPEACPEGPMYLAFMGRGGTSEGWQELVRTLVNAKLVKQVHQCHHDRWQACLVWIGPNMK